MGLLKEFREFAMRGSVVDLAVGVVIGGAFGKIVSSFVDNIIMPPLNLLVAKYGVNFSELAFKVNTMAPTMEDGQMVKDESGEIVLSQQPYPILNYGPLIQTVIDFVLIAAAIFLAIKLMNSATARFEKQKEEAPAAPPEDIQLLREIRDSLKSR